MIASTFRLTSASMDVSACSARSRDASPRRGTGSLNATSPTSLTSWESPARATRPARRNACGPLATPVRTPAELNPAPRTSILTPPVNPPDPGSHHSDAPAVVRRCPC
ncbi:hypothetical protein GCM10020219_098020 [Nonomuraea dietziae]